MRVHREYARGGLDANVHVGERVGVHEGEYVGAWVVFGACVWVQHIVPAVPSLEVAGREPIANRHLVKARQRKSKLVEAS